MAELPSEELDELERLYRAWLLTDWTSEEYPFEVALPDALPALLAMARELLELKAQTCATCARGEPVVFEADCFIDEDDIQCARWGDYCPRAGHCHEWVRKG